MYKVIRYQCIGKNPTVVTDQIEINFSMLICLGQASTSQREWRVVGLAALEPL